MKITDKRSGRKTFKDIKIGQCFTIPEDDDVYVKIDEIETDIEDFNAFSFREYALFEIMNETEVIEVADIEIILK